MQGRWVISSCVNFSSRVRTVYISWLCAHANVYASVTEFIYSPVWARRNCCGQGRLSLSGAEVRRQRQEHRPGCLDLLSLSACFVTMQNKEGGGGGTRMSSAPTSCFWDSVAASGSIGVFNAKQHCFHCGPEGKPQNKESVWQACSYVLICHATDKHSFYSFSYLKSPTKACTWWLIILILGKEP